MRFRGILARFGRQALILPPVLIGAVVLFAVVAGRDAPQQEDIPEASRPLLVIKVPRTAVVPRVLGFGTARPGDIWSAVAEVKGRIIETHPELKAGAIIRQGEMVVRPYNSSCWVSAQFPDRNGSARVGSPARAM